MKIALGTDHAGYRFKEIVKAHLEGRGIEVLDFGTHSEDSVDYADFVVPAAEAVVQGKADYGIVFGGSGNGEAIAANKVKGVRCGVCWNVESARLTKLHNNANVIALGGRMMPPEIVPQIVDTWLDTAFEGGRHIKRLEKVHAVEARQG
ncbi:MAG: sugar-phosphate isomerase RpiB/LacA/LacB family [Puniceicoccaceae bacterium 5H]|nr:MAG: sugar-phosphate isomerase RpiB/LacA/LacB family [Puniceicoccaceae bacterium 5H]